MPKPRADGQKRDVRLDVFMAPSEFQAIEDYRYSHRIWSRGEAVRQLIALGLSVDHAAAANAGAVPGCNNPAAALSKAKGDE